MHILFLYIWSDKMKTVLITGGARGIGKAIALAFAKNGYNVGINYNTSYEKAMQLKNDLLSLGVDAEMFKADVSNKEEAQKLADSFIKRFGHIDVLVNNAGVSLVKPLNDVELDEWDNIISTNLSSAFYVTKPLLPYFIKNKCGSIINIASIWGECGASCEVAYSASKAGLIGYTKALAKELGASGIRVNAISPGFIETDMNKCFSDQEKNDFKNNVALMRLGNTSDVSGVVLFLASDEASYLTGQNIVVDGCIC